MLGKQMNLTWLILANLKLFMVTNFSLVLSYFVAIFLIWGY